MYNFYKLSLNIAIIFNTSALKCPLFELFPTDWQIIKKETTGFWTLKFCIYNVPTF